jgi:hypothetical protein
VAADGVVEESRVDLVVEIFAGQFSDGQALALGAMAFEVVVPLFQDKRNPDKLVFDEDNLHLGKTLEHTEIDQFRGLSKAQATFLYPVTGLRLSLHAFQDSQRRREILPLLGLLMHRRFNLKLAVEIVLGRIDGDAPADFAVEVEP